MREGIVIKLGKQGKDPSHGWVKANDDGTDAFIHRSDYPGGQTDVIVGDELRYDVVAGAKGPRVANVAIIKRGTPKPAATTVAATPPPAPVVSRKAVNKLLEIEVVNPPRDPDATTDKFIVHVVTRKDDKPAKRNFTAHCDQTIVIEQSFPTGLAVVTTFTPDTPGHYPLYVGFDGLMAKIIFKLDSGQEAAVRLRK